MEEGEIEQFEEIGSSRGDARVLSLSALEEDAGEPPMDHLPFLIRSSSSVCPSILSVRTRLRLARGVFRVAPMFPSITLIMSN